ncbi:MAG: YbaK/EbsC family protein [Dehalococcoidia bacterium]
MAKDPGKPLAVRMLEQRKVAHELFVFPDAIRDAAEVARVTGWPAEAVYKTLVVEEDPPRGKPRLVMMPADSELDLKAFAIALGIKKARMASHSEAERHTGLLVGGISALALVGKGFPVFIDVRALDRADILVSAGQRGMDARIAVADLIAVTGAKPLEGIGRPLATG